jgi:hypothetical protein
MMSHPSKDEHQAVIIVSKRLPKTAMHGPLWQYHLFLRDEKLLAPIIITVMVEQISDVQVIADCFAQWTNGEEPPQT